MMDAIGRERRSVARGDRSGKEDAAANEVASGQAPVVTTAAKLYDQLKEMAVSYHFRPGERIAPMPLTGSIFPPGAAVRTLKCCRLTRRLSASTLPPAPPEVP
ncbi:hypothetical protein FHS67_005264 [Aminobacter aminovorans]|uniref:Uncharacterized protein n=1 Tax=Aminobacter aminovorans TaxID=83263 RepID=A0AAC8YWG2_AMIAI|nr:hypothetical protein AA2016_6424 [Aminobacter aminovorans]MBB3708922.1 hypothetical protein [Aminobacter aminovorans]